MQRGAAASKVSGPERVPTQLPSSKQRHCVFFFIVEYKEKGNVEDDRERFLYRAARRDEDDMLSLVPEKNL